MALNKDKHPALKEGTLRIGIIGRPNVGKSTLFNRIVGRDVALVRDEPGITRDWQAYPVTWEGLAVTMVDTPGIMWDDPHELMPALQRMTVSLINHLDLVFLVIDGRAGVVPPDLEYARVLRSTGLAVVVVVNKCESDRASVGMSEAYSLGFDTVVSVSAQHGLGMEQLAKIVRKYSLSAPQALPAQQEEQTDENRPLSLVILGRPNVGKSTLLNALLGYERVLTGPQAGLTRDAISATWVYQGRKIRLIDTAGVRRMARIQAASEHLSVHDTWDAVRWADVVVMMVDGRELLEKQDLHLLDKVAQEGRGVVLGLNKWDLVLDPQNHLANLYTQVESHVAQLTGMPCVPLSALHHQGLDHLMDAVIKVEELWRTRLSTALLNRWLKERLTYHPPPRVEGGRAKIKYITQMKGRPPTFVIFGNRVKGMPESYERYLANSLRQEFNLWGVPLRFLWRQPRNPFARS